MFAVRRLKSGKKGATLLVLVERGTTYVCCNQSFLSWKSIGNSPWQPCRPPAMDRILLPAQNFRRRLDGFAGEVREAIRSAKVLEEIFEDRRNRGISVHEGILEHRLARKYLKAMGLTERTRVGRFVTDRVLTPEGKTLVACLKRWRAFSAAHADRLMSEDSPPPEFCPAFSERSMAFKTAMEVRAKLVDTIGWLEPLDQEGLRFVWQYRERRWALYSMWLRVPEGRRLFEEFPQLAWLMANSAIFKRKPVTQPLRSLRSLVLKPRRILQWLDLPPTRGTLNLLRRVRPSDLNGKNAYRLKTVLNHPRSRERLHDLVDHFKHRRLSMRALSLLAFYQPISQPLLKRILEEPKKNHHAVPGHLEPITMWRLYCDTLLLFNRDLEGDLDWRARIERVESMRGLQQIHDEMVRHLNGLDWSTLRPSDWDEEREIPAPLNHPDWLRPITRQSELVKESQEMKNCVATFAHKVVEGTHYVFGVHHPDAPRCTLLLVKYFDGWHLSQLEKASNKPAPASVHNAIQAWLRDPATAEGIEINTPSPSFCESEHYNPF